MTEQLKDAGSSEVKTAPAEAPKENDPLPPEKLEYAETGEETLKEGGAGGEVKGDAGADKPVEGAPLPPEKLEYAETGEETLKEGGAGGEVKGDAGADKPVEGAPLPPEKLEFGAEPADAQGRIAWNNKKAIAAFREAQYDDAIAFFQVALEVARDEAGPKHRQVATINNNMGEAYRALGNRNGALRCLRAALEIDEELYGKDDAAVARDLNNLASLYFDMEQWDEALELYKRALVISEAKLGDEHEQTVLLRKNIHELETSQWYKDVAEQMKRINAM